MDTTDKLLAERATTHGNFTTHALITQGLKRAMGEAHGWQQLDEVQREGLEMIQHKIGRILNGNPHHRDHWDDIAGYARLCSERCEPKTSAAQIEALVRSQHIKAPAHASPQNSMHDFDYADNATPKKEWPTKTGRSPYADNKQADDVNGVSHSER